MGFGKLIKNVADGIREKNEERRERKHREELREFQRKEDIAAGKFCKICARTGEFHNKCDHCLKSPICDECCARNEKWGTVCENCVPNFLCFVDECNFLSSDSCVSCERQVCQKDHWYPFFVEKGQFFTCVYHKGPVCINCVEQGKTGTFRKHFNCPKCGNELQQKIIN